MSVDSSRSVPNFVTDALARLDVRVDEKARAQLARFLDLLLEANQRVNLTGIRDPDQAWLRHIIDSLTLLPFIEALPADAQVIDVGSGGGLPGVPIAITRGDLRVAMLEATGKKADCLKQFVLALGLSNTTVLNGRAEQFGQNRAHRQRYDVVVCRAIGPMRELLEYTLAFARVGGAVLAMKGPSVVDELAGAGDALALLGAGEVQVYDAYPEDFDNQSVIVRIEKETSTSKQYPRVPGLAHKSPL